MGASAYEHFLCHQANMECNDAKCNISAKCRTSNAKWENSWLINSKAYLTLLSLACGWPIWLWQEIWYSEHCQRCLKLYYCERQHELLGNTRSLKKEFGIHSTIHIILFAHPSRSAIESILLYWIAISYYYENRRITQVKQKMPENVVFLTMFNLV